MRIRSKIGLSDVFVHRTSIFKVKSGCERNPDTWLCVTWLDEPQQTLVFSHLVLPRPCVVGGVSQLLHHRLRHSTGTNNS